MVAFAGLRSLLSAAPRRCALGSTLCGGAALIIATQSPPARMLASDEALGAMWAAAVDGMIDVPGCESLSSDEGVLYMMPSADAPAREWPRIFAKSAIFSLTASNPMGMEAPAAANVRMNELLEEDLKRLRPEPRAWWHSYGFNVNEGWRENGFSVAYGYEERVYGRQAILKLARKYRQKAVYMYVFEDGHLQRDVIMVGEKYGKSAEGAKEKMAILPSPPRSPLAAKTWEQPAAG